MNIVTIEDAAEFANVDRRTIYRWAENGHLRTVQVEGVTLLDGKDFRRYLSERNSKRHTTKSSTKPAETMSQ
jgi:excisionase family DNA binding protein